jgi:sugar lactone lactonase YvrE
MHKPRSRRPGRKSLRFESLESRQLLSATPAISISDATAIEGNTAAHFRGAFVEVATGGFNDLTFGPDGNLYAATSTPAGPKAIDRYDGITGEHIDTFVPSDWFNGVRDIVFRDGYMYVGSEGADEVLRFDATSGSFVDTFVTAGSGGIDGPHGITFGPDANGDGVQELYVSGRSSSSVVRYDGVTGLPLGTYIAPGSGGLNVPEGIAFDPSGTFLYVTSSFSNQVLKYNALTGAYVGVGASTGLSTPKSVAFGSDGLLYVGSASNSRILRFDQNGVYVDDFVPAGAGGMERPYRMTFGPDGDLFVSTLTLGSEGSNNRIFRFGTESEAVFTVSLSEASTVPVSVDFATASGTASASDFVANSGTITFAPGQTSRTVMVRTSDDLLFEASETFSVNLSNATGAVIADGQGVGTIQDDDSSRLINISDATSIEGSEALKLLDQFIAPASGGLTRPRVPKFGPDSTGDGVNELYVASADTDEILRYDGSTGAFLDVFVSQGSGGLNAPADLEFAPDGNLYVSTLENVSPEIGKVLRYDGHTGAFLQEIANGLNGALGLSWNDDALYISTQFANQVLKYDSSGLNVFVPAGSGGLDGPRHALFGTDANGDARQDLYVASQNTRQVLRYDGVTGNFIDVFATMDAPAAWIEFGPDGDLYAVSQQFIGSSWDIRISRFDTATRQVLDVISSGQANWAIMIDSQNIVYNPNIIDQSVYRYGPSSLAAFTVNLSAPSATPVTVNFNTINGSAIGGNDYDGVAGSLTFAPGQISRTILVSTLDDATIEGNESFVVNLSNAVGATIADGQGVGTIYDDELPPTKFYVVNDATTNLTYEYGPAGTAVENYSLNSGNTAPRGAASTVAGDKVWVVDANRKVYVYNTGGGLLGSWTAGTLANNATPEGIAINGTDVWIVDAKSDKVFKYAGAASRLSGSQNAASSFTLNSGNTSPKDIVTDGTQLWVVDDGSKTDKVFKYALSGIPLGSWTIDSANKAPTGITIDPSNVSDIWIVDSGTDRVYQYNDAASRTSGSQAAAASFALAVGNANPQGIADPPPGAVVDTSIDALLAEPIASLPNDRVAPKARTAIWSTTQLQPAGELALLAGTLRSDADDDHRANFALTKHAAVLDAAFATLEGGLRSELATGIAFSV